MIYAISDIHGQLNRYNQVISKLTDEDTLYIVGDVLDRGEYGIEILQDIITRDNVKLLLGNHEMFFYEAIERMDPETLRIWLFERNGGRITLDKYHNLQDDEKDKIRALIKSSPLYTKLKINDKIYLLVHGSFIDIEYEDDDQTIESTNMSIAQTLLWDSPFKNFLFFDYYKDTDIDVYVHGHVPVQYLDYPVDTEDVGPYIYEGDGFKVIDIDGGCALAAFDDINMENGLIMYNLTTDEYEVFM